MRTILEADLSMVSAMITPAILILAAGSLVSSTLVRLGRVVDQTRVLLGQSERFRSEGNVEHAAVIERWLDRQLRRAALVRNALWGYYIAIALFLLSSIVLAFNTALHGRFDWLGALIVVLGGIVLMLATSALVVEVGVSAGSLKEEVELHKRRFASGNRGSR
jgi:hypothetical protein